MKYSMTTGLLSLLFLIHGTASADEPALKNDNPLSRQKEVLLKFNLQPGDKYHFSSVTKQNIVQEAMGQQMTTTQDIVADYIYDIQAVQNGMTTINVTFGSIKMDMDVAGMQKLTYDSDNPDGGTEELKAMSNMVGKSFLMEINEEGSVEKIEGLAEIISSIGGQQAELLKQSFGDSSMIQNMNQVTNIYPNKKVRVGDKWMKKFSGPVAGIMQSEATSDFSLSDIEGDLAILEMNGEMDFSKLEGGGGNPMLQGAEFKLKGTQTGTLEVDIKSGLPLQTKLKQAISGNLEVQGMQIPMTITSDITITGKKL
ncbi:DUF6263 family protein [Parapedobacter tibetensis]|uniref:DUF6263 family protein n=1 Tax=Parapedobacter tibetensis TaxID=2972951 RepID=UPI00214D21AF|nr:DUF6263 family protein [Parapedobacter tibetensis]